MPINLNNYEKKRKNNIIIDYKTHILKYLLKVRKQYKGLKNDNDK